MELFGLSVEIKKAAGRLSTVSVPSSPAPWHGMFGQIREAFTGAWQKNVVLESQENILAFSAVYACVSLIANDISKLRIKLTARLPNGTWQEIESGSPFLVPLRDPNRYQTRIQFISSWMTSKLLHGNAYILKERDGRGMVGALYVLDPRLVTPMVADDGAVYYRLNQDNLAQVRGTDAIVAASEIIHDRMICPWHPLVGVSPIFACGASATQGIRIQANSAQFFENMSRPSGILTAPTHISDETAARLKAAWDTNYRASNIGRVAVLGDSLTYEAMTIPPSDAQLIEQLRWTIEDVARCFHVPVHMIASGQTPTYTNVGALTDSYYRTTLQALIENMELLLNRGLGLPSDYDVEVDLDALLRMDAGARFEAYGKAIGAGWMAPNEARLRENLPPVKGGDSPYLQQQQFSLEALAERDQDKPFSKPAAGADAAPALAKIASSDDYFQS